jgi:hypothetical protein
MRGEGSLRETSGIAALAPEDCSGQLETCSEGDGPEPAAAREGMQRILTRDERSEALRFWQDISGMWPKTWWSPGKQWQDFQLRRYARRRVRALEVESRPVRSRVAKRYAVRAR